MGQREAAVPCSGSAPEVTGSAPVSKSLHRSDLQYPCLNSGRDPTSLVLRRLTRDMWSALWAQESYPKACFSREHFNSFLIKVKSPAHTVGLSLFIPHSWTLICACMQ